MADEKELTPEEKLLRVIQKGDPGPSDSGAAADGSAGVGADVAPETSVIASGIPTAGRGLVVLNRVLGAVAALFLLLAGYETYLNMPAVAMVYPDEELEIGVYTGDVPTVSLSDTLDMFAKRRVFGQVKLPVETADNTNVVNLIGWRAYARENLTLKGMSDVKSMQDGGEQTVREAIVMDNKVKKMLFLRAGSTLILAEQAVSVTSVEGSAIELKKDDEVLKIE
jgi:hypothetical protein